MKHHSLFIAGMAALALSSCKPNLEAPEASAGPLDLSSYVAVGNSLTAGYADNSLYREGQENAYPVMLAKQFALVGGGEFKVPYLPGTKGYPALKRVLGPSTDCKGVTSLSPIFEDSSGRAASNAANVVSISLQGPFNNTGVPGIRAIDYMLPSYPGRNPYSARFFSSLAGTPLLEINRAKATFFTAWIGNNDVLGYALAGGSGKGSGGSFLDDASISDVNIFTAAVDSVLNRMTADGAKGAVINIPDVTSIPYFTTVPAMGLTLNAANAAALNAAYAGSGMSFAEGANYWVVQDTTVPGFKLRQMKAGEYLTLTVPQDSLKCYGMGTQVPIPMKYVLDINEVANVRNATATFNQILMSAAESRGLAFIDINSYFKTFATGVVFNGVTFTTTFVSGGTFSLDGVHLTPRGYAFAANHIINGVNAYYKSSIPTIDVNKYSGIRFP